MFRLLQLNAVDSATLCDDLQRQLPAPASLLIATGNVASMQALDALPAPERFAAHWIACSSCLGAASACGVDAPSDRRLSALVLTDPLGSYGVASVRQRPGEVQQQAAATVLAAIARAGRTAELPGLIWCMQAPGFEEQVISGIQQVVGDQVQILGGSAADDDVSGQWCQYDGQRLGTALLVIAVLYPTVPVSSYFSSGYSTGHASGTVTAVR